MRRLRPALTGLSSRRGSSVVAGAAAGVLVALSLPPFGWWPLAWVGLALLLVAISGRPWRMRLAVGVGFGLADYLIGLAWVQEFSVFGYVAVVLISTAYAVAAVVAIPASRWRWMAVGAPAAFVLSDWARDRFPVGGLPLGGLALGQAAGPLAPVARLGGSLGVVAATVLVGVLAAGAVRLAQELRRPDRPPRRVPLIVAVAVVAVALPVIGRLSPDGGGGHLPPLRIALVQGGGPRGTRAITTDPQTVFDRHLQASAGITGPVDLVVWPEGVLQSQHDYQTSPDAAAISRLAQEYHATFLVGVEVDSGRTHYLNEVTAWGPTGTIEGPSYVKHHLVPFGEYVPYRSFFQRFFDLKDVPLDAIPGNRPGYMDTPAAPIAVMISYEVFFDEQARGGVNKGGQLLVVPTNTASYRSTQVPTQEVAADQLRAWETGRWLVQVTPTGFSTVVSPDGSVVRRSTLDAQQVIEATVPRQTGKTVYDYVGDSTVVVIAGVVWLLAVILRFRARRPGLETRSPDA
jgi:apolipoprotein N-acyltransferase